MQSHKQQLQIIPQVGLKFVQFGQKRELVRATLGPDVKSFKRTPISSTTDFFMNMGLQVTYDEPDDQLVEFIEVTTPAQPIYQDVELLERLIEEVVSNFKDIGIQVVFDGDIYRVDELGISFYAPDKVIKSVGLYQEGYYDEEDYELGSGYV